MPVSFNLRDKFVWMRNDIEPQSLEIVQKMLNNGEIIELYIADIHASIFHSLNLNHLKGLSIVNIPCYDLDFLSSIANLKYLKLDFSSIYPEDEKVILKSMPAINSLESLFLEGKGINNLNCLPMLPNLKELGLREINDESLAFLEAYPLINDMWISECNLKAYSHLISCQNLIRLRVFETPLDFDEMTSSATVNRSLKILELCDCPTLKNLEPLRVFEKLRYLEISLCNNLRSTKGLEKCRALEIIYIEDSFLAAILKKIERFLFADIISIFNNGYRRRIDFLRQLDAKQIDYLEHYTKYFQGPLVYPPED
jgi:hypothetical protein